MRNFCSPVKHLLAVDVQLPRDKSVLQKDACLNVLLAAMQASSRSNATPSEQFSLDSFEMWYAKACVAYEFPETTLALMYDESWIYINLNTGAVVIFVAAYNDGDGWESNLNSGWLDEDHQKLLDDLRSYTHNFQ